MYTPQQAIEAIKARESGEWDNEQLVKLGHDFAKKYIAIVVEMSLGRKKVLRLRLHYSEKVCETYTTMDELKQWLDNPNINKIKKFAA